jgi:antitoxin component YwqK of YwqJK toxin-antitoxin module
MDTTIINVVGDFYDYDMKDKLFLKATMLNNNLEGVAQYYDRNGKVIEEGTYQNNIRQGRWTFYYPNGNVRKIYNYSVGEPTVLEAYTSMGKAIVTDGNGRFKTDFSTYKQCDKFEASGQLLNGKKDGKWVFSNPNALLPVATEIYENGNFIKGNSYNYEYTENPKILLTNFYANENLNLLDNLPGCPGDYIFKWQYNDSNVHRTFYPEEQERLSQ